MKKLFTTLLTVAMLICTNTAMAFSGEGEGTAESPFLITNADQLAEVSNNLSAYYKLMNDIDLTEWIADNNPSAGWKPIGKDTESFSGNFDGNYKRISGLKINRPTTDNIGLFSALSDYAIVCRLIIDSPNIIGSQYVGCIAGFAQGGSTIYSIKVNGGTITGNTSIGGIAGELHYTKYDKNEYRYVFFCDVTCKVKGINYIGGICGRIFGAYYFGSGYYGNSTYTSINTILS